MAIYSMESIDLLDLYSQLEEEKRIRSIESSDDKPDDEDINEAAYMANRLHYKFDNIRDKFKRNKEKHNDNTDENHNNEKNKHRMEAQKAQKKNSIIDKIREIPGKVNHVSQRFKLWTNKIGHFRFYRKYLDRIQSGLFSRYASSSYIYENQMKGDPVQILKNEAQVYIQEIAKGINNLYHEILDISHNLENKITAEQCINVVQKYCSEYVSDKDSHGNKIDRNKIGWDKRLLDATRFKIAKILLRNGEREVYGYTMRSMVQKGYPKPNHLIVTLFVANPEEKPTKQYVSDVFEGPDSFEILANADKKEIFNISNMTDAVLNKTVKNNVINDIKIFRNNALQMFNQAKDAPNRKDEAVIIDKIWDGIRLSCKELLSRKVYIIDCINIYFDMILRIDKLAYKAINSMLETENGHMDSKYRSSLNVSHKTDSNKYDDVGNFTTKTERNIDHVMQSDANKRKVGTLNNKHADLVNTAKKLNNSFK